MGFRALVFDSGMGGLTVVREIRKALPGFGIDYVADDEFRPYGTKSEAALNARLPGLLASLEIMLEPDIIVLACNTASVTALSAIREAVSAPVVGVVPAIKPAAAQTQSGVIGVLGTPGTVRRKYVDQLIKKFAGGVDVHLHGSVNLVRWAEDKMAGQALDADALAAELAPLSQIKSLDTVVMACTHFPLLAENMAQHFASGTQFVDSGEAIARRVSSLLSEMDNSKKANRRDLAFLMGPQTRQTCPPSRAAAFADYGFDKIVGLES